ncbi:radical SAM protein [Patescibacteria group bacterium]
MSKEFKEDIGQLPKFKVDYWTTSKCDMECIGCYGPVLPTTPEMNFKEFQNVFLKLKMAGADFVTLSGGEPFKKPEIVRIIRFLDNINFKINLSTNGTQLMENYSNIAKHVQKISLPLDGSTQGINEKVGRREYHFGNITNILKFFKDKNPKHLVKVGTVVSKLNISDIENIGNYLFHNENIYKPNDWRLYQFYPINNPARAIANKETLEITNEDFFLTSNKMRNLFPEACITVRPANEEYYQYLFITPDGYIQITKGYENRAKLDLINSTQKTLEEIIKSNQEIVNKTINKYSQQIF